MRKALVLAVAAAFISSGLSCPGGGSAEEAFEVYNAHMATKDFDEAAAVVTCDAWERLPREEQARRRHDYAAQLAAVYDREDLDYGRAEIRGRAHEPGGGVALVVAYPRRSRPSAPPVTLKMTFKKSGAVWYYFVPAPPAGGCGPRAPARRQFL